MPYDEDPKPTPEEGSDGKEEESFSFLQETIKPKPVTRKKILTQLVRVGIYGLIFGVFACLSFFALKPWAQNKFQGSSKTVTIPEDEATDNSQEEQEPEVEQAAPELNADSYQDIMQSMYDIAQEAAKSVVSVENAKEGADWTSGADGAQTGTAGLIVADNGQELLIVSNNSICEGTDSWRVLFADDSKYAAALKKQDKNCGLAVFSIRRTDITESTWNAIKVAVLGNSNVSGKGDMTIALGNVFGYEDGAGYGIISSGGYEDAFPDIHYKVLTTDITASDNGTGILFNMSGEAIGLISPSINKVSGSSTANALAISSLKATLELMVNGQSVPYVGIYGATITDTVAEQQNMPTGVYVTQIKADSPAMAAGIQSGDILQEVDGTKISTRMAYEKEVQNSKTGDNIKIKGKRRGANGYVDIDFTVTVGSQE